MKARLHAFGSWLYRFGAVHWPKLLTWVHGMLSESDGTPSSTRIVMVAWHALVGVVWLGVCIAKRDLVPIHGSVLTLLGVVSGLKVGQKLAEPPGPPCNNPPG